MTYICVWAAVKPYTVPKHMVYEIATHIAENPGALPLECNLSAADFWAWLWNFLNNVWRKCWLREDNESLKVGVNLRILLNVRDQGCMPAGWAMIK